MPNKFRKKVNSPPQNITSPPPHQVIMNRPPPQNIQHIQQHSPPKEVIHQSYPQYIPQQQQQRGMVYMPPQSQIIQGRPKDQVFPPPPEVL